MLVGVKYGEIAVGLSVPASIVRIAPCRRIVWSTTSHV